MHRAVMAEQVDDKGLAQRRAVAIGEKEEEALDLDAPAIRQQLGETVWAQAHQPLEKLVHQMKAFLTGQFIEQFEFPQWTIRDLNRASQSIHIWIRNP